jgi:hypothetical protein
MSIGIKYIKYSSVHLENKKIIQKIVNWVG